MEQHTSPTSHRKNPSRETCEKTITRILMTEVLEHGQNLHFRSASDFMNYFESLYPASDALTKQVQRAIKALDMPKDEKGYFICLDNGKIHVIICFVGKVEGKDVSLNDDKLVFCFFL